jgi:hypothetical protein
MKGFTKCCKGGTASPKTTCNRSAKQAKKSGRWMETVIKGLAFSICGVAVLSMGQATAADFSFTTIADTRNDFTSLIDSRGFLTRSPVINDSGTVAFFATPDAGYVGIYTANNGAITEIINTNRLESLFNNDFSLSERFYSLSRLLDINNNGTVAFIGSSSTLGFFPFDQRLFTNQNGEFITRVRTVREASGGFDLGDQFQLFDLNEQDEIAYVSRGRTSSGRIFSDTLTISRPNQPDTEVFGVRPDIDFPRVGFIGIGNFAINNQSEVTFNASSREQMTSPIRSFLLRSSDGVLTTLVDDISTFGLDVNDRGDVVFGGGEVFFNGTETVRDINAIRQFNNATGELTTIANTSGVFSQFGNFAINNSGSVAFIASLDEGGEGIFQIADSELHEVITTGDALNGSTVTDLSFFREGFNNNGQIAFFAELADGTQGIFRAERNTPPTSVPEPASALGLLVLGSLGLALFYPTFRTLTVTSS